MTVYDLDIYTQQTFFSLEHSPVILRRASPLKEQYSIIMCKQFASYEFPLHQSVSLHLHFLRILKRRERRARDKEKEKQYKSVLF